jgi:hypothetical protein
MAIFRFRPSTYTLAACKIVKPGDTMEFEAGDYPNVGLGVIAADVTIRGLPSNGAYPHFKIIPDPAQPWIEPFKGWSGSWTGRGLCVVYGKRCWIENMEFSGAKNTSSNGSGIRHHGEDITVKRCRIHHNQDGFLGSEHDDPLTAAREGGTVWLEENEIHHNGAGGGQTHNVYLGFPETAVFLNNHSYAAKDGHLYKSKAKNNIVIGNRFETGDGTPSFACDIDGGNALIANNTIDKEPAGPGANTGTVINYFLWHEENAPHRLQVLNNRILCPIVGIKGAFVRVRDTYDAKNSTGLAGTLGHVDVTIAGNLAIFSNALNSKGTAPYAYTYGTTPFVVPPNAAVTNNTVVAQGKEPATGPEPLPFSITPANLAQFIANGMQPDAQEDPMQIKALQDQVAQLTSERDVLLAQSTQQASDINVLLKNIGAEKVVSATAQADAANAKTAMQTAEKALADAKANFLAELTQMRGFLDQFIQGAA